MNFLDDKLSRTVAVYLGYFAAIGLITGLYAYNYGAVIFESIVYANGGIDAPVSFWFVSLMPLAWAAFAFSTGIFFQALLEVPTGVFADSLGRKFATITNLFFRILFCLALLLTWWFGKYKHAQGVIFWAVTANIFYAFHYTFFTGSFTSWLKDTLDEIDCGSRLTEILARGFVWYRGTLLLGSVLGIYLWLSDVVYVAYGLAALLCLLTAIFCHSLMEENRGYQFVSPSKLFGKARRQVWKEIIRVWLVGSRILIRSPVLWVVFAAAAAGTSLIYLVNYVWPVFTRYHFVSEVGRGFSNEWIILLLGISVAGFLGSKLFSWWNRRYEQTHGAASVKALVVINTVVSVIFSLPIFLLVCLFLASDSTLLSLPLFTALLSFYFLVEGAKQAPSWSLQHAVIPPKTQERSTILSLGSMMKQLIIVVLVFFGVGKQPHHLAVPSSSGAINDDYHADILFYFPSVVSIGRE